ncbi:MAG: hypothetical protein VX810_00390 [Bacteroidota bacterium]|nr:hypothetical protein [Bacteroidota bacterium]
MSKQEPKYYKRMGQYVALNRSAKRMFKKKGIKYLLPTSFINIKDLIKKEDKGLKNNEEEKKIK